MARSGGPARELLRQDGRHAQKIDEQEKGGGS